MKRRLEAKSLAGILKKRSPLVLVKLLGNGALSSFAKATDSSSDPLFDIAHKATSTFRNDFPPTAHN
jgi:hypothetical protein